MNAIKSMTIKLSNERKGQIFLLSHVALYLNSD